MPKKSKVEELEIRIRELEKTETERKQMEEALRESEQKAKQNAELDRTLAAIGRIISSTLSIDEVYERFAAEVKKLIPSDRINIELIDLESKVYRIEYVAGIKIAERLKGQELPVPALVREAIRTKSGILLQPEREEEFAKAYPEFMIPFRAGVRSVIVEPLISGDEVIGVLYLASLSLKAYLERHLLLAEKVASQIAGVIANARLYDQVKKTEKALRESENRYRNIFEENRSIIFIRDPETEAILDVNPAACSFYGYSREEMIGMKLSHILHGHSDRIAKRTKQTLNRGSNHFTARHYLKSGESREVEAYNNTIMIGDKKAILAIMHDITDRRKAEATLARHSEFERLVSKMSSNFAGMKAREIDAGINRALASVGAVSGADRAYVFLFRENGKTTDNTHEWCAGGIQPQIENLQNISFDEELPWFSEQIRRHDVFHVPDVSAMPAEASLEQQHFEAQGIKSLIAVPMGLSPQPIGFLGLDAVRDRKTWTDEDIYLLHLVGEIFTNLIERNRAEKALRESENKYKNLFENSTDFVYTLDLNGNFTDVNKAAEDLTGYTKNELIGMNYKDYIPEAAHERIFDAFNRLFHTGKPVRDFPFEVIIKDGSTRYFETCVSLLKKGKQIIGFQGSSREITERKQAEEALRESEEKYRLLFNSSNDSILVHQPSKEGEPNKFIEVNEIASEVYGYTREEFLQLTPADLMCEEDKGKVRELLKSIITKGHDIFEIVHKTKEGKYFPVEASAFLSEFQGKPTVLSIIRDITERKETEKALAKGKNQLSSLVNNLIDSIVLTDMTGTIKFVNNSACELFGKEMNLLIKTPIGLPTDMDKLFEIEINSPDGKNRYAEAKSRRIDWDGEPSYLISLRDITARKHIMEEREKIRMQLQQSQKLESIGRLTGGIAHDFNNMLSVILGYGEDILNNLPEKDPLFESAKEIIEAGKRSVKLTRQLLAFSRRQTLQPEILNLNLIVANLEKMLRRLIGEDINLITKLAEEPDLVKVDLGQIEQVLMNLALNARDAMPHGGRLTIETANIELDEQYAATHVGVIPGKYVMLSISDSGCGMDEETRTMVFEPFFTTKEKSKGTGLGLSTVYGIVKQSGGYIWVYSEPGQGTVFKIYLPKTKEKLSETRAPRVDDSIYGKGEMIFVVEDEPSLRKLCERMLKLLNYNVMVAANGGEALLMVEEKKLCPDLMVTDMIMPGMSGKVLVDRLKKSLPDLKVLYMSGYTDNTIVNQDILDPGIPFIQKPFNKDILGKAIRSILGET